MMKRIALSALLSLCAVSAGAGTFRSERHLVKVDVQRLAGDSRQFNVQVFDGESRNHLAHLRLVTDGQTAAEAVSSAGSTSWNARVIPYGDSYLFEFVSLDGNEIVDQMRAGFAAGTKPEPATPRVVRAGHDVEVPAVLHRVEPLYTDEARAAGAVGTVIIEALIAPSGFVHQVTVLQPMGHGLSESALDAVKQWQFAPTMTARGPAHVLHEISIEFKP